MAATLATLHQDEVSALLDDLDSTLHENTEIECALRMLIDLKAIPFQLVHDAAPCREQVEAAFVFLPSMLALMADGIEARNKRTFRAVDRLRGSLDLMTPGAPVPQAAN
jgi:hypothetical protein